MKKLFLTMGLAAITAIGFTGCNSEPTIDCSSDEAFQKSMEIVTAEMTPEEKMQFGLKIIGLAMEATSENPGISNEELRCQLIGGKTASEIMNISNN